MQQFYTVRAGDTLNAIASRWSIPLRSLIEANNIADPSAILPGQQLSMPPGITAYTVKSGDTVYTISQQYGIPVPDILEANGLTSPNALTPGMVLTVPAGVPFYIVRQGDTLYQIAGRYNVATGGRPRPDLISAANPGLTGAVYPGMTINVPYMPSGGTGWLAVVSENNIELYDPPSGEIHTIPIPETGRASTIFWSPSLGKIAYGGSSGTIYIILIDSGEIRKIDQISSPAFMDWSLDSDKLIYSNGREIRVYTVSNNTYRAIARPGASFVQWFPDDRVLLFEAKDPAGISQLFISNTDGSREMQITDNKEFPIHEVRLSPDGRYVLYTSPGASISEITVLDLTTRLQYQIPGGPQSKNFYPSWSPDSSRIAYSSAVFQNGKYFSLIRMSGVRGEADFTLAISDCYTTPVTWSPDGRGIAYLSGCGKDQPPKEVWSLDLTKPVPVNILSGHRYFNLDWSYTR